MYNSAINAICDIQLPLTIIKHNFEKETYYLNFTDQVNTYKEKKREFIAKNHNIEST